MLLANVALASPEGALPLPARPDSFGRPFARIFTHRRLLVPLWCHGSRVPRVIRRPTSPAAYPCCEGLNHVIDLGGTYLDKARESVTGARVEFEGGRYNNSANRSYYAVFQAAVYALQMEGFRALQGEWGHDFVQAQFNGHLINRRHLYPTDFRSVLLDNLRLRTRGDYETRTVTEVLASRALQRAERFVGAIVRRQENQS